MNLSHISQPPILRHVERELEVPPSSFAFDVARAAAASIEPHVVALQGLEKQVQRRHTFSIPELLSLQVHAHSLHMKMELCAKAVESFHAGIRKFQHGQ
jgi:hypothetical protein